MLKVLLGNLEKEVLEFLWQNKGSELKNIWESFNKKRGLAYTTIATIIQRLRKKGLIYRKEGKYYPSYNKKDFTINLFKNFVRLFVKDYGDVAFSSFAEGVETLDKRTKEKLIRRLEVILKDEK